jgi:4-aminobutyrate aminotransferase-like enzyme
LNLVKSMATRETLALLRAYESRNVTFIDPDGTWPIVWERARGVHVWDANGKRYLDLTAAFGVAAAGHANPRVVRAGQQQMGRLLHAMGDVHPHALKAQLARELSRITFERWAGPQASSRGKVIFGNSGFEAVEAALKTAMLATGKAGVIAFEGAYHGLGYGALNATHRDHFRSPFRRQLREFGSFVAFPTSMESPEGPSRKGKGTGQARRKSLAGLGETEVQLRRRLRQGGVGAILVEPIQVRGGIQIPAPGFLPLLRELCDEFGALLVVDEIYTGLGRTGRWFACEHSSVVPDLICLGKALTGGFPLSACVGKAALMDAAWPPSTGEAIHTSTFLGHPVGCAMALAQLNELRQADLVRRSRRLGDSLRTALLALEVPGARFGLSVRSQGLLAGLELRRPDGRPATEAAMAVLKAMLRRGFILLPEGEHANVISFTPPLTISEGQLRAAISVLGQVLREFDPA